MNEYYPRDALKAPRYTGIPTFMRLPIETDPSKIDVAIFGVPFDSTVTYRPGARFGPRDIRVQSALIRPYNPELKVDPFRRLKVADMGDVDANPLSAAKTVESIFEFADTLCGHGVVPLAVGGDHTITLPILRAMKKKHGPVAVIHFDAHTDTWDEYFGVNLSHGTWLRRATEEGLIQGDKTFQVGLRGQIYGPDDMDFALARGFHQITSEQIKKLGVEWLAGQLNPLATTPVYVSLDIDWIDPAFAPGTGVPQVGGPDSYEAVQAVRGLKGLNIVGADVVEVCPPYDSANITSILAANLLYEILCVLPGVGE
jgi:guanidinobutyrase